MDNEEEDEQSSWMNGQEQVSYFACKTTKLTIVFVVAAADSNVSAGGGGRERAGEVLTLLALVDVLILLSVIELFLWWVAALPKAARAIYILMAAPLAIWILKRPVCGPVLKAEDFGLSLAGWRFHCVVLTPVTIVLVGLCFYFVEGSSALIPHFLKRAVIYPLWGLLQNLLILGFLGCHTIL